MELRKASEIKKEHIYTDTRIAIIINDAAYEKKTKVFVNVDLITDKQVARLKELGYSLYNRDSRLEISWEYAIIE
tara:strand:+ start:478 stop:702 length:225 start_codon:yes stop_codon:yes gene_type:complete